MRVITSFKSGGPSSELECLLADSFKEQARDSRHMLDSFAHISLRKGFDSQVTTPEIQQLNKTEEWFNQPSLLLKLIKKPFVLQKQQNLQGCDTFHNHTWQLPLPCCV